MSGVSLIRASARVSDYLFRHAFPLYVALYDRYKRRTERDLIALVRRSVRSGDRVVDVGANIGFYAEILARAVGPSGHVHAFEPEPLNFRQLAARARGLPQLHAVNAAVTEQPGVADLYLSPHLNVDHRTYRTEDERRVMTVEALSLDAVFAAGEGVHFVKMDVQGGEYAALLGMRQVVTRSPDIRILMELWPFAHDRYGAGTGSLIALVESLGLRVHRIAPGTAAPGERLASDTPLPERADPEAYFDVLCVRPGIGG